VFRHTALFLLQPETTLDQREEMLRGLASLEASCPTVRALDFGENALPGAGAYDVALHLDFDDADGYAAYVADPGHSQVAEFNASISLADRTARVDWDPADSRRAGTRHVAAFVWAERAARDKALATAAALARAPGVISAAVSENAGNDARAWDWILDVAFDDLEAARAFLASVEYRAAMAVVAPAVVAERIAHVTHVTPREST
jgi:hypothetical protein